MSYDEIPSKFWKKWMDADDFERLSLIEDLPICRTFADLLYPKLGRDSAKDMVATMLNSYFEDLANYMETGKQ